MVIEKLEEELEDVHLVKRPKKEEALQEAPKVKTEIMAKVVKFTNEARKQYGDLIKSVLVFGSAVRGDTKPTSDADVWVILDDTATKSSEDLEKVQSHLYLIAHELKDVHVQTTRLTDFWNQMKLGSPELVNFLRYGLAVYDTGFVKPVQRMLNIGLIPPSEETISLKARASEARLRRIKIDLKSIVFDLRYTAMDMVQAAVMYHYKAQADYKDVPRFLEKFAADKKLEKIWIEKFAELDKLWKDIDHKIVKNVDSAYLQRALDLASEIVERFKRLIPQEVLGEELPPED